MSYTKLHESILDSTIWQEDLHVKVVWITMLAMKDIDGIVAASIPGLAKRAGVTTAQCEEALAKFLGPDAYSRSKAFEGRRIREIDGGWEVLNHDKYRDQLDAEDQREKAAKRQRRRRERLRLIAQDRVTVTVPRDESVIVRHADPDTDPDRATPSGSSPSVPEPPDPVAIVGAERDHEDGPIEMPPGPEPDWMREPQPPPGTHRKYLLPNQVPHVDRDFSAKLSRLLTDSWQHALATHNTLRLEGIDPNAHPWEALPGTHYAPWISMREIATSEMRTHGYDRARERIRHRVDVAAAAARRADVRHLRWFTPSSIWDPRHFARDVEQSVEQASTSRFVARATAPSNRPDPERRPSKRLGS